MSWSPISLPEAIAGQREIRKFLLRNGVRDLVGDYGELIAHQVLGGSMMPPVNKSFDIEHPRHGRVQVKTRQLVERLNGSTSNETRAVLDRGLDFDSLFHLVLRADFSVKDAVIVSVDDVARVIASNSGKISMAQSQAQPSATVVTKQAIEAASLLEGKFR